MGVGKCPTPVVFLAAAPKCAQPLARERTGSKPSVKRILLVKLCDICAARVSGMDHHAVTKSQGFTGRERQVTLGTIVVLEIVEAKYVSGK
jgi:hypothetical protein